MVRVVHAKHHTERSVVRFSIFEKKNHERARGYGLPRLRLGHRGLRSDVWREGEKEVEPCFDCRVHACGCGKHEVHGDGDVR